MNRETGIRWDKVKEAIERAVWEADRDNPGSERRSVFLGSVFSLTPSGKYYLPFACSNVTPCPQCAGVTCEACAGCGSREAHLDELYNEKLAAEAAEHDLYIFNGEGDPCDVFAGESRDAEEGEGEGERAE